MYLGVDKVKVAARRDGRRSKRERLPVGIARDADVGKRLVRALVLIVHACRSDLAQLRQQRTHAAAAPVRANE